MNLALPTRRKEFHVAYLGLIGASKLRGDAMIDIPGSAEFPKLLFDLEAIRHCPTGRLKHRDATRRNSGYFHGGKRLSFDGYRIARLDRINRSLEPISLSHHLVE